MDDESRWNCHLADGLRVLFVVGVLGVVGMALWALTWE